ncbi:MAG: di-heme enzyme [Myxococcales bacterium]|nr:di-heme enzyme [Myxococcales bacterium]
MFAQRHSLIIALLLGPGLAACGPEVEGESESGTGGPEAWEWHLPEGFPEPYVPEDNPMSAAKVELGRYLFYDTRLSANETMSCGGCHDQSLGFADGKATPEGSTGDQVPRNAMSLANVAYFPTYTWANPNLELLEQQARVPLFGEHPVELGATGHEEEILGRFRGDADYVARFAAAFPDDAEPVNFDNIVYALASFERTMVSGDSPYDRYLYGKDDGAISEAAKRGFALFFSERLECYHCHAGLNLAAAFFAVESTQRELTFFNNGLYNIGGDGSYPVPNVGLYEFTGEDSDMGRFRAPSLRNIAVSGPYMHDGSIETLEEVIDFYAAGGREITDGPYAGDGRENPHKDPLVRGFTLTDDEKADLLAFLESFTDETFLTDPALSDPFAE